MLYFAANPLAQACGLDADVINRFLAATTAVMAEYLEVVGAEKDKAVAIQSAAAVDPVTVIVPLAGDIQGHFMLGCGDEVALAIARAMVGDSAYPKLDDTCLSALAELGNMIGGKASTSLSDMGFLCTLAPPAIIRSANASLQFVTSVVICMPVATSVGVCRVSLGLKDGKGA